MLRTALLLLNVLAAQTGWAGARETGSWHRVEVAVGKFVVLRDVWRPGVSELWLFVRETDVPTPGLPELIGNRGEFSVRTQQGIFTVESGAVLVLGDGRVVQITEKLSDLPPPTNEAIARFISERPEFQELEK